ncbi:hypothetical protein [Lutibacter sp.]|uniref:hypothetical protein n=1 Tax=Lutibacter sp. TaxID=1925666 RepID=UPI0025BFE9AA|nr:hypothetical protein [Lutibacter sp.]MCF6181613.1 hypothetical protein [Lutibacter sp.]
MKKVLFLAFSVITFMSYSQEKFVNLTLSSGISTPSSSFSDNAYANNGSYFELAGAYYFSKFGIGLSLGQYTNPTDSNLDNFINSLNFSTINSTEDWKVSYYGFGPEYKTTFNKIEATFLLRTGIMSIKPITLESSYVKNIDIAIPFYSLETNKTYKVSYFSTAFKIGYNISRNLNVFANIDYLSAISNEFTITEKTIVDANKNGIIDAEDFIQADGTPIAFDEITTSIKPQTTNFGVGISYNFGNNSTTPNVKRKRPGRVKYSDITLKRNPVYEGETTNGESPLYVGKNKVSITLTNSAKEKADKKNKQRKLVNVLPKNNSRFKSTSEIKNFTWKLIGSKIVNPHYIIEVIKISSSHQVQLTYISKTTKTTMNPTIIFKENKLSDGQYSWKVTETTTGISSNNSYFTMGQCEIDFTISNDTIECLGYVGANRKFKICFDTTYSSASGDLTFANLGSGLSVYDQSYTPLTYTLVSPNPTLVTQIGASATTVSYCFEVTVSASVTSIGFGLQGDDLDPSPIVCQPGVSSLFDELPSCLCDDCDRIELSFDDFNISLNGATGNQFNFNGNINVNVPIYGIEFQIQSYSYSANPSACTEGVSSVEESGMILMPGTTINGSTSLQLFNETASGSSSSNNNATKDIKYTSNTSLTGPIPVNLTIGLPGPLSGLDPSCCVIDYTVCIKVKVFYEEGNCKSCVFTHCFQFNNQ